MVGKKLSHYKITAELGRGGMGIVYKAEDTKLDRTVAIKVLPSAALSSEDDRARFYREAKAAAQLHHPHIASVFEIDEAVPEGSKDDDLRPFIAMEYIEGETLHDRIQKGPLKLEEAVRIASEIASALEAAHEKSIVHRDIKAANVMLTSKGSAKVLDFGLAQTAASTKLTRMGSTLGTVAYMSPEQARGEEVDLRTDLWSLGAVLYEMIAGKSPFPGDYEQAVVYEILNQDPEPLTAVRTGVPMGLEWIVSKCLAKKSEDRYQTSTDLLVDLRNVDLSGSGMSRISDSITGKHLAHDPPEPASTYSLAVVSGVGVVLIALSVLVSWYVFKSPSSSGTGPVAATVELIDQQGRQLNSGQIQARNVAISPDGSRIVFMAELAGLEMLYVRDFTSFYAREIPGTEGGGSPAFSPDGRWIAYCDDRFLYKVLLDGGLPTELAEVGGLFACRGVTWLSDETLIYVPNQSAGLYQISSDGSDQRQITFPDRSKNEISHRWPRALPDQKGVTFTIKDDRLLDFGDATVAVYDSESSTTHSLFDGGTDALVLKQGLILYARNNTLMAAGFDIARQEVTGAHRMVVDSVSYANESGEGNYDVSSTGTLIFNSIVRAITPPLILRTAQSDVQLFDQQQQRLIRPRLSPDGRMVIVGSAAANDQLLMADIDSPELRPFTLAANNIDGEWTPDGEWISFSSDRGGTWSIYRKSVNGDSTQILYTADGGLGSGNWSSDGKFLFVTVSTADTGEDIWVLTDNDGWTASELMVSPENEHNGRLSPDGSLLLHLVRTDSGTDELYVQRYPELTEKRRISSNVGWQALWDGSSRRIYYRTVEGSLVQVNISTTGGLRVSSSQEIFPKIGYGGFDVSDDGQSFLVFDGSDVYGERPVPSLRFISGWTSWLEEELQSN